MLRLKAYAKLNLVLEVLGRRDDGYHEIASIMQTIGLYDVLTFETAGEVEFSCSTPGLQADDNLVLVAARALRKATGVTVGAKIVLEKKVPRDAGLGGGSSDAAAALRGLNRLWGLGLAAEKLAEIAAGIGSDVPFFIYGGTCLAEGRGERVTPLRDIKRAWFVLIEPDVTVHPGKTAALYGMLRPAHYSDGGLAVGARALLTEVGTGSLNCYNTFDKVAGQAYAGIEFYLEKFGQAGAGSVHLAGSGPFLYSMFDSRQHALAVKKRLLQTNMDAVLVPGVARDEAGY